MTDCIMITVSRRVESDVTELNRNASSVALRGLYGANELSVQFSSVQFISFALYAPLVMLLLSVVVMKYRQSYER